MEMIILLFGTVVISIIAGVLLKIEAEELLKYLKEEEGSAKNIFEKSKGTVSDFKDHSISITAILILIINVLLALFLYLFYHDSVINILNYIGICSVLYLVAWCDRKAFIIPNRILLMGLLFRGVLVAFQLLIFPEDGLHIIIRCFVTAGVLFIVCILCRLLSPGSIGFGDVKLLMLMGLYLGTGMIWGAMMLSMIVAFIYSLILLITKRANRKTEIPFAPILLIGTVLAGFLTSI